MKLVKMKLEMIIGVDFDNTIVDYDELIYSIALEKGLIPKELHKNKTAVRNFLREGGREDDWTELQGYIYGPRIFEAKPFEGVMSFFTYCKDHGIKVYIVSHKTKTPVMGEKHELHDYARKWLEKQGFHSSGVGLPKENVFLELTKKEKMQRIIDLRCTFFIDDLPEFLSEGSFPGITRVLFDPHDKYKESSDFERVTSWDEAISKVRSYIRSYGKEGESSYTPPGNLKEHIRHVIRSVDPSLSGRFELDPIKSGKNNRVFCLEIEGFGKALLKAYFKHSNDQRDRLKNEFSFSQFAWNNGIRCLHEPLVEDKTNNLGLYTFIEGRKIEKSEVNLDLVKQALSFFSELNRNKDLPEAKRIGEASEACFSINQHIETVKRRIEKLRGIHRGDDALEINKNAFHFVEHELVKTWVVVLSNINQLIKEWNLDAKYELSESEKFLSPSDFGFHNALLNKSGIVYFVDFEYAGWDDGAKMICDFFCQPEIRVGLEYFDMFVKGVFSGSSGAENHIKRTQLLLPLYKIKWCCIMLNEFLNDHEERRKFAYNDIKEVNPEHEKVRQLKKVKEYIKDINTFMRYTKNINERGSTI